MNWQEVNKKRIPFIKYGQRLYLKMYREFASSLREQLARVERPEQILAIAEQFDPPVNVREYYQKFYLKTSMAFSKDTARGLKRKKDLNTDIQESIWLERVLKYVDESCGYKISQVYWHEVQDIIKMSRKAVNQGISEGWGIDKIVRNLFSDIETRDKWKAMRIARTEVVSASNYGSYQAAADSELALEKVWLHPGYPGPSGFLRDDHAEMNMVTVGMNEDFILPDQTHMSFPGEGPPEHVINCRCTVAFQPIDGGVVGEVLGDGGRYLYE